MRTTVRLPDELYARVRRASEQSGETVTSYLERALRAALDRPSALEREAPYRVEAFSGNGLKPGVDLDDSAALLDVMDADAGR